MAPFDRPDRQLRQARWALLLGKDDAGLAEALRICGLALPGLDPADLSAEARGWAADARRLADGPAADEATGVGYDDRARAMTPAERADLLAAVDTLGEWVSDRAARRGAA